MSRLRFAWLVLLAGVVLVLAATMRPFASIPLFAVGLLLLLGAMLFLLERGEVDVLGDPDEDRRRRGAAGWQKPVAPPTSDSRPGGLPPPRRRED